MDIQICSLVNQDLVAKSKNYNVIMLFCSLCKAQAKINLVFSELLSNDQDILTITQHSALNSKFWSISILLKR